MHLTETFKSGIKKIFVLWGTKAKLKHLWNLFYLKTEFLLNKKILHNETMELEDFFLSFFREKK